MPEHYTGCQRRLCIDPTLTEFVQVGDKVYKVADVIKAIEEANLTDRNRSRKRKEVKNEQ